MANPGKSFLAAIALTQARDMFPDDDAAKRALVYRKRCGRGGILCVHCDSVKGGESGHSQMQFRRSGCDRRFPAKTNYATRAFKVDCRKWLTAICLLTANLKCVYSMKLHREIRVAGKTARRMSHRVREALARDDRALARDPTKWTRSALAG